MSSKISFSTKSCFTCSLGRTHFTFCLQLFLMTERLRKNFGLSSQLFLTIIPQSDNYDVANLLYIDIVVICYLHSLIFIENSFSKKIMFFRWIRHPFTSIRRCTPFGLFVIHYAWAAEAFHNMF